MTTENNSIEIINATATTANTMSKYTVEIADNTGHSTFADLDLETATENILTQAEKKAHWVYINGEKFEFEGSNHRSKANMQKLQQQLQAVEDPNILLTGVLRGGEDQE
jgi:hypothetical protein